MRLPLRDAWKDWHVAVRVLTGTGHDQHMRSIFCQLHCLLVCFWIPFKVLFLTFKCKPWSRSEISFQFQLLLSGGRLGVTRPSGLLPCGYEILYLLKSDPSWSSRDLFHRIYVSFTWTLGPGWTFLFLNWLSPHHHHHCLIFPVLLIIIFESMPFIYVFHNYISCKLHNRLH